MSAQPRTMINTLLLLTPLIATGAMTLQTARPAFAQNSAFGPSNPFYAPSTLPFQAPPFDKIKDADYQPAIEAGMAQQRKEVDAIADDRGVPTFENTLVAMETSGRLLDRAMNAFELVSQANLDPALQKVKDIEAPKLAAHEDAIFLNAKLFLRVTTIYNQRVSLKLDSESQRLLDFYYRKFVHAGAKLSDADKDRLKKLNEEESTLSNTFTPNCWRQLKMARTRARTKRRSRD